MSYVQDQLRKVRDRTLVFLKERNTAYRLAFGSPAGKLVLDDLAQFCFANRSVYHTDQRMTDIAIGRHEVLLRIRQHLKLTPEQMLTLFNGQQINEALATIQDDEE